MAKPTTSAHLVQVALIELYDVLAQDKTKLGMRTAVSHLAWLTGTLNRLYGVPLNIAMTDAADAGVSEFIGGGEGDALSEKDIFRTTGGTADLTDNALQTAKGSAVATGDVFVISGADAVVYLGNNSGIVFDNVGESTKDFVSIGS